MSGLMNTYSLLGGLELLLGSYCFDFLLHSAKDWLIRFWLTDVDLEATVVLAVEVFLGVLGVAFVLVLDEGVGALLGTKGLRR